MKKYLFAVALILNGCASLPLSPSDLKPSPTRSSEIATQEAILPNTSYELVSKRMNDYATQCLNITRKVSCGQNCESTIKFTPVIVVEKQKLILYLKRNGFYIMMAEALTNGKTQQIAVHGFDSFQHGYTTQATIDWLSDRKKVCPRLQ